MNKKAISLLCITALLLSGCGKKPASIEPSLKATEEDTVPSSAQTIEDSMNSFTAEGITITYDTTNKTFETADHSKVLLYASYTVPKISIADHKEASDAITDVFSEQSDDFRQQFLPYLTDAQKILNDEADYFVPYSLEQSYSAKRCDEHILSMLCCNSQYLGGAHGDYRYSGFNFDTRTGTLLKLDDIADDKEALLNSAQDYINSQLTLPYYETRLFVSAEEAQSLITEDILTEDNWYFTNTGLTFIANYEVLSSYAGGASFFTVPYQKLDGLNPKYQYTGSFISSGLIGTTLSADIDSNGEADAVYYDTCYDEETDEVSSILTLNGTDYSYLLNTQETPLTRGATAESGLEYYLIDIDPSDSYIELAIQDPGLSATDCRTYFFRYVDFNLTFIGCMDDLINNNTFRQKDDGTFTATLRIPLTITTAYTSAEYIIDKDQIKRTQTDWYSLSADPFSQKIISCRILQDITVYEEASRFSGRVTLTSSDGPLTLLATDNEDWVMVQTKDDAAFYLYLKDLSSLESGENLSDVLTCF